MSPATRRISEKWRPKTFTTSSLCAPAILSLTMSMIGWAKLTERPGTFRNRSSIRRISAALSPPHVSYGLSVTHASMWEKVQGSIPSSVRPSCVTIDSTSLNSRVAFRSSPDSSSAFWSVSPGGSCTWSQIDPSSRMGRNSRPTVAARTRASAAAAAPAASGTLGRSTTRSITRR